MTHVQRTLISIIKFHSIGNSKIVYTRDLAKMNRLRNVYYLLLCDALWAGKNVTVVSEQRTGWHKKTGTFENPNKNWRNPRKKNIDRNWTITTSLLRRSNPNYQCLKITSCRWRLPPRMHSFTATTHFKSSRSFVSLCVCCMLCRMRLCRILPSTGRNFQKLIIWITVS